MIIQNHKISLTLGGADIADYKDAPVPFAKDGRVSNESWEVTMDCAGQPEKGSRVVYTEAELKQVNTDTVESFNDGMMSPADFISRCMTGEDAKALSDEETPLEEYTSSQLERALSRVKEQRFEKQEAVENHVEKEREIEQAREESVGASGEQAALLASAQSQLLADNLPVTRENVEKVAQAADMALQSSNLTSASMEFFIGKELPATPESISGSVYGAKRQDEGIALSRNTAPSKEADTDFSAVEHQVEKVWQESGREVTEEVMDTARWLYDKELPVTPENIIRKEHLEELKELSLERILERITGQMADGILPEKADLFKISVREAKEEMDSLLAADDLTLRQTFTTESDFLRARRQLEEIRLTMTVEAARAMSAKGISLDITNLQNIVEELKRQEQQAKESLLEETGLPVTASHATLMSNTIQAAKDVLSAPVELLGETISTADSETFRSFSERGVALKEQYEKAAQTYEAVGTEVRKDLGDSIRKAFGNTEEILADLGLENTAANQRAVRILGYNQMDVNKENIGTMKAYDAKVTTLMERMKPQVVARLISDGMNPLELSLDELEAAVNERYEEVVDKEISFRKFLWKMEHHGEITPEERQSMIGVYRLLDKIEKSDGAVIGQVIKEGKELSLSAFLSATRTKRAEGMDVVVDDNFGGLEQTRAKGTSISEQIGAAYVKNLATRLQKEISPQFMKENADTFMDMSLETLLENSSLDGMQEELSSYYEQMAAQVKEALTDSDGQIQSFLQQLELPDTIGFYIAAKEYRSGQRTGKAPLWTEEEREEIQEKFDRPEELDESYEKLEENQKERLAKEKENDDITYDRALNLARMAKGISFYRNLRKYQMYEVPILTEQGVTNCHVTIQSGSEQKGSVEISMQSENLGRIQATFRVKEKHVKGFVTAERTESMEFCQRILYHFEKDLEEMGFTMDRNSLIQGSRTSLLVGDRESGTKKKELYQVAKCFITNVARKDEER